MPGNSNRSSNKNNNNNNNNKANNSQKEQCEKREHKNGSWQKKMADKAAAPAPAPVPVPQFQLRFLPQSQPQLGASHAHMGLATRLAAYRILCKKD